MTSFAQDYRFAQLGTPKRIWTVSAIYGDMLKLQAIHDIIEQNFIAGDRLVYFGNYTGGLAADDTHSATGTIDQLLFFRKCLLTLPGVEPNDIVYLRGVQEELWRKLLQLQFAHNPAIVFEWMLEHGLEQTLVNYGGSIEDGRRVVREGILSLTRWTNGLRQNIREHSGHIDFTSALRRAAFTDNDTPLLFVHSGIDISKPLISQGDNFWWNGYNFNNIDTAYDPFDYVIRGHDPEAHGIHINGVTMSLDSYTQDQETPPLTGTILTGSGEVLEIFTI